MIWLYTLAAAVALPSVAWVVTDPIAGHSLEVMRGSTTMHVTLAWVIAGALIPGACGLALATLIRRLKKRSQGTWLVASWIALVTSLGGPLDGTTTATVLILMSMHVLVAVAVIPGGYALAKR